MKPKSAEDAVSQDGDNSIPCSAKLDGAGTLRLAASTTQKLVAKPVLRIVSRATREVVGYVYEWNNGERQAMWTTGRIRAVEYAPLSMPPYDSATK